MSKCKAARKSLSTEHEGLFIGSAFHVIALHKDDHTLKNEKKKCLTYNYSLRASGRKKMTSSWTRRSKVTNNKEGKNVEKFGINGIALRHHETDDPSIKQKEMNKTKTYPRGEHLHNKMRL